MSMQCPDCHNLNRAGARHCAHCGHALTAPGAAAPTTTISSSPRLVIRWPNDNGGLVAILDKPQLTLGRESSYQPDIVVPYATVSRHPRVLLMREGACFKIVDQQSTNGLLFKGRRVPEQVLQHGDLIRIGDAFGNAVTLTYEDPQAAAPVVAPASELRLSQQASTLGRDPACDLVLDHPSVSRRHARVERQGAGFEIVDLNSTNGTFVGGQRVRRRLLQTDDVVQIGPYRLLFDGSTLQAYDEAGTVRLDAINLRKEIQQHGRARVLLNDICLSIQPREFVALVGGSGAGKSTLMDALNGFRRASGGQVRLNGDNFYQHFDAYRSILGYVPQDDIIHRDLTVQSALGYAAELRLPTDISDGDRHQRVAEVLSDVEMGAQKAQPISSLSGGQRKRVNIGVELLAKPGLFFLDEPTSGLDPGLEKKMMGMLRRLADQGRTILLVTHATANIRLCDHVAFMAQGRLCYFGPPDQALKFFGAQDFSDIYSELEKDPARWESQFRQSAEYQQYVEQRLQSPEGLPAQCVSAGAAHHASRPKALPLRQFWILARRYFEIVVHDRLSLAVLLAVMPFIGLLLLIIGDKQTLVGSVIATVDERMRRGELHSYTPAIEAQRLLLMMALAVTLLGVFAAAYELIKERPIYKRERMINLRLVPYLCSKIAVLLLFAMLQCLLLLLVVALKIDLPGEGVLLPGPLELYLTFVLADLAGIMLGLFISALMTSSNSVIYIILLVLFLQIIFSGAIFNLPDAAKPVSWLTLSYWTLDAVGSTADLGRLNDQSRTVLEVRPPGGGSATQQIQSTVPELNLNYGHTTRHLFSRWFVLGGFAFAYGALACVALRARDGR